MDTKTMLLEFSATAGLPQQQEALDCGRQLLEPYGKVTTSPLGNLICTVRPPKKGEAHILLDAHLDEIGLLVTGIDKEGFVQVGDVGGVDPRLLSASRVTIHGTQKVLGVVTSIPPHLTGGQELVAPTILEVLVDVGLTKEEGEKVIRPGDRMTFQPHQLELLNGRIASKALDNRAGCVSLIKALDYLKNDLSCGLTVLFSTMEEIGGMGAETGSYSIQPTHALVVDVSYGNAPHIPLHKGGDLGAGPMIGFSPLLDHGFSTQLVRLAKEHHIPFQQEVMGGRTGTNADSIVTARGGVPTALLSIPLLNMHMPVELVDIQDVENTGKLIAQWVTKIGKGVKL